MLLFSVERAAYATIGIRDMNGRLVARYARALAAGYNNLEIDMAKPAASIYLLQIVASDREMLQKSLSRTNFCCQIKEAEEGTRFY